MANTYYLTSASQGLVIDIKEGSNGSTGSGSLLQALNQKPENNQYWSFEPVSSKPGYFHIVSADQGLAIDIKEGSNGSVGSGSPLQALNKKDEDNQYWTTLPIAGNSTHFWLLSASEGLAIDIKESSNGSFGSGSPLQALTQKTEANQHWFVQAATGNSYNPVIKSFTTDINLSDDVETVSIAGTGFFPGSMLIIQGSFTDSNGTLTQGSQLYTQADLGGNFDLATAPGSLGLSEFVGQFDVTVICTQISSNPFTASANWNGGSFSDFAYQGL